MTKEEMNKRIRKLIEQATIIGEPSYPDSKFEYFDKEKFAELIVKECIDIVAYGGEFASRTNLVEKLQNHFGVEE